MAQWKKLSVSNCVTQTHLSAGLRRQNPKKIFWLASLARLCLTYLNYIYCPRVILETGSPLVMVIVWYIIYFISLFTIRMTIIMTKQLLIICEW